MSPSGGAITTVEPSITWSPENRAAPPRAASTGGWRRGRGCAARRARVTGRDDVALARGDVGREAVAGVEADQRRARPLRQAGGAGRVVLVGVGDDDRADPSGADLGDAVEVLGRVGPGVEGDEVPAGSPTR